MVNEILGHRDLFSFHKKYDNNAFSGAIIETISNSSNLRNLSISFAKIVGNFNANSSNGVSKQLNGVMDVLRKDLAAEGEVDVLEDGLGNKNLRADEVLGDNHVDSPVVGQTVRLDSSSNLFSKTEDLGPKFVFSKKDKDDNNVNVAIDPITRKDRSIPIQDVSDNSSTTGATSRRARSLTSVLPPRVA
ncbi:hypothetical protein TorRG33x02_158190 [Trema orientale]|uniref:Uncharacterized protein n=1 Tax=Trema orientale TaxID=63057 RepID=A0A2P5ESC4_TREOI|nr:hypothetical protein TorRG33x02_158190 [Trema orientale]